MMGKLVVPGLVAIALAAVAQPAAGQVAGKFQIVPSAGAIEFDDASALKRAAFLGLDASYFATRNLAIGLQLYTSRPVTDGTFFPLTTLDFGDTTYVYAVAQQVTLVGVGAQVQVQFPLGRLNLFVTGGGGAYRFYLDPRRTQTVERFSGSSATVGGGVDVAISEYVGVRLEARDLILMDYDRDVFDGTLPYERNTRIPDLIPAPAAGKDVIHNIRLALGFSFVPGGR
ncbi:MAG: outer membrane beta-barrel protein [Gemmatimonadetes bacterium]|nr:outer membrane beta-barrel protein [Gemmatimonadota bacterium]